MATTTRSCAGSNEKQREEHGLRGNRIDQLRAMKAKEKEKKATNFRASVLQNSSDYYLCQFLANEIVCFLVGDENCTRSISLTFRRQKMEFHCAEILSQVQLLLVNVRYAPENYSRSYPSTLQRAQRRAVTLPLLNHPFAIAARFERVPPFRRRGQLIGIVLCDRCK